MSTTTDYKEIRYIVTSLWKRSDLAEGNPMHKPQTRIEIKSDEEPVNIIPIEGFVISSDWHRDKQIKERNWIIDPQNRAILIQTQENQNILKKIFTNLQKKCYKNMFGENIVIKRIDNSLSIKKIESTDNIFCIGDILQIKRNSKIVCELQISSPRWPCYKLDRRCNYNQRNKQKS